MATPNENQGVSPHLVDDFESAFQNCISLLTSQEHFNVQDSDETKGGVENSIQRFLESARQMETFFLNKRLVLSVAKPDHVLNEEMTELQAELERKDKLIEKHHEKLQAWQALMLSNAPPPPPPSTTPSSPYPGTQAPPHQSGMSAMPQSTGSSTGPQMSQQPPGMLGGQQPSGIPPGQYPGPPAGHPGPYNMPPPAYPQGPLAYLERM